MFSPQLRQSTRHPSSEGKRALESTPSWSLIGQVIVEISCSIELLPAISLILPVTLIVIALLWT